MSAEDVSASREVLALARSLQRLGVVKTLGGTEPQSATDWWLYALVSGLDCEGACEDPDNAEHSCTGAMDEIAVHFGWPQWFVDQLRDARIGLRALLIQARA